MSFMDKIKNFFGNVKDYPTQIKSTIIITVILAIVVIIIGLCIRKVDPEKKTPKALVPLLWVVDIVNNFTKQNIGKRWKSYAPYFLTLGIILFVSNISGMFALENPTSYIMINMALAIITFFMVQITGIISLGIKNYLAGFVGPVKPIAFIMIPINIVSEITLPISLTLRLLGNIISGTVISIIIKGLLGSVSIVVLPFTGALFDLGFGLIQALVFVILTIIFTSQKIDEKELIFT